MISKRCVFFIHMRHYNNNMIIMTRFIKYWQETVIVTLCKLTSLDNNILTMYIVRIVVDALILVFLCVNITDKRFFEYV